jgi:hypothetical protein
MSTFRALFLSLSKMPPILSLFIILGLAVIVTMWVMGLVNGQVQEAERTTNARTSLERSTNSAASNRARRTAYYSLSYIPANSNIENKQIEARDISELELWDDATALSSDIVGRSAKHAIPMNAQIRSCDLQ